MTQEEKDIILKKIGSIYGKVVKGGWDYMEGRDDALSRLRVFVNKMNITEYNTTQEDKELLFKPRNNMKYIDAEKLNAEIERKIGICEKQRSDAIKAECYDLADDASARMGELHVILETIASLQHEQQKENKLPNKRTRVNYAICNLQSFKPLREAIVLDDYVYDESKCYRENLLNYINAIPENRLTEIRSYLKEKGWWPYDDDADWMKQEQPEVDLQKEIDKEWEKCTPIDEGMGVEMAYVHIEEFDMIARHFYELGRNARKEE